MIKFEYESSGHPDYMKMTGVLDKEYTVSELIFELLVMFPKSRGYIIVRDHCIEYEDAKIQGEPMNDVEPMLVEGVSGISCYGNVDFTITAVPKMKKDGGNRIVDITMMLNEMQSDMKKMLHECEKKTGINIRSIKIGKHDSIRVSTEVVNDELVFE